MKTIIKNLIMIALIINFSCKKVVDIDDSACPNCPIIERLEPAQAQPGDSISIIGQRFGNDKAKISVEIQTIPQIINILPAAINLVNENKIRLRLPDNASGVGKIVVKLNIGTEILASNDPGIGTQSENQTFAFISKANFTTNGIIKGKINDEITLQGNNFGIKKEDVKIEIGVAKNIQITSITNTEIKFKIPENIPIVNTPIIVLIKNFQVQGQINFEYNFPEITSTELSGAKDQTINIAGKHFGTDASKVKVMIGTTLIPTSNIGTVTETQIPVKIPQGVKDGQITLKIYEKSAIPGQPVLFNYVYTYNVFTFKYSTGITAPIEIKEKKGRINVAEFEDNVVDFKVLKSNNVNTSDNIYLASVIPNNGQIITYSSKINSIGGSTIASPGITIKSFNIPSLTSTFNRIKWIVPFNNRFLFSHLSQFGFGISYISEFETTNTANPLEEIGGNFRSQNFYKVAYEKTTLNRLYTYLTNTQETTIYLLQRGNSTIGPILPTSDLYKTNLIKNCIDIEFYKENLFLLESTGKIWRFNLADKSYTELLKGINTDMIAHDLTIDQDGIMYALDKSKSIVYRINNILVGKPKVEHIVGNKNIPGKTDGAGLNATFQAPTFIDNTGKTIYVYDGGNRNFSGISQIRYFTPSE